MRFYTIHYEDGSVFGVYSGRRRAVQEYFTRKKRKLTPPCTLAGRPVRMDPTGDADTSRFNVADHNFQRVQGAAPRWDKDMTLKQIEAEKAKIWAWEPAFVAHEDDIARYGKKKTCGGQS
jgi:hypothetical protein